MAEKKTEAAETKLVDTKPGTTGGLVAVRDIVHGSKVIRSGEPLTGLPAELAADLVKRGLAK